MKLTGRVTFRDLGAGAWVLEADNGKRYELRGVTGGSLSEGAQVEVEGEPETTSVSTSMVAPGFRVKRWNSR